MGENSSEFLITDDEFNLLSEITMDVEEEAQENKSIRYDINGSHDKDTLLFQLGNADDLQLTANYGKHRLVFPVQLNRGDFANFSVILKSPKIFEQGAYLRSWRLLANKNIYLLNEQGETLNYQIKDISASGISLLINDENKDNFPEKLNNIYLQLPNNERLAISATKIRRVDDKTVAYLLKSTIDDRVLTLLVEYLFECHAEKYPEVHQKQKSLMLI